MALEDARVEEEEAMNAEKERVEVEEEIWPLIAVDHAE